MDGLDGLWLMSPNKFEALTKFRDSVAIDQNQLAAFIERTSTSADASDLFYAAGGVARVPIIGTLTKTPDFFFSAMGGGNAVYGDIIRAIESADSDPAISRIVLEIDSGGGSVAGFFDAASAISATRTPIEAQVTDMAASAAFGLAAATDKITVNNRMAMVGSVGIVTTQSTSTDRVTVTSTEAPKKSPDAGTDEGLADIRAMLDGVHAEFVGVIAQGRGITSAEVNKTFGRGATVIAGDALRAGMIDVINSEVVAESTLSANLETNNMLTITELRANHPALFAEAVDVGVAQERDRVSAHITYGESCKRLDLAAKFIKDGSALTQTATAEYMTAGANAAESSAAAAEEPPPTPEAPSGTGSPDLDAAAAKDAATIEMFDTLETNFGVTSKA